MPKDFPLLTTVQYHFYRMRDTGLLDLINEALVAAAKLVSGREAEPTAAIIDSQSVNTTESVGSTGFDAGKKGKGSKRHIATDTDRNLLALTAHTADVKDRDGVPNMIEQACDSSPRLTISSQAAAMLAKISKGGRCQHAQQWASQRT